MVHLGGYAVRPYVHHWGTMIQLYMVAAVSHLNELNWHDMLVYGAVGIGALIIIARLLMRG